MENKNIQNRERYRKVDLPGQAEAEFWLERLGNKIEPHHSTKSSHGGGSSGGSGGGWRLCSQHGCLGEALSTGACLSHSDKATKNAHLAQVAATKKCLSLNGLVISQSLWDEIVLSPIFVNNAPIVPISFIATDINARIVIKNAHLTQWIQFVGASIFENIEFRECTFDEPLTCRFGFFNKASISCHKSQFLHNVDVSYSEVQNTSLGFTGCTFKKIFTADGFNCALNLSDSEFVGNVSFKDAIGNLILSDARILGSIALDGAELNSLLGERLFAETANYLGPCKIQYITLKRATFNSRVHVDVISDSINLSDAVLDKGGLLDFYSKSLQLSQVSIGGPFRVSAKLQNTSLPEIHGLLNSDAGQISFARVDLSKCSFYGAHGLENVSIESTVTFSKAPWWHGKRRFIADEYAWRAKSGWFHSYGWKIEGVHVGLERLPPKMEKPKIQIPVLAASQVALIYRDLRRSLESKSDIAGSADYYYGEMEMRKWSAPFLERVLLWLYWLFSGYSLRVERAFIWWLGLIAFGTNLMKSDGFEDGNYSIPRAMLFSIRATLPGVKNLETLALTGQIIETGLRIFGPLLIALFLIAVRTKLMRKTSS